MDDSEREELQERQLEAARDADTQNFGESRMASQSSTEVFEKIFTPTQKQGSMYDKYHALRDYTLTYTKNEGQIKLFLIDAELISALLRDHLIEPANMFLAESKLFAGLLRSQDFSQQRELTTARHHVERVGGEKKKGLFK